MIQVNGKVVALNEFPDGSFLIKESFNINGVANIRWNFENNAELVALIFLTNHIRRIYKPCKMSLLLPYIPNARQDRVKTDEDVFTLKYFAQIINSLHFDEVKVLDPHSSVSEALIDNINVVMPRNNIETLIKTVTTQYSGGEPIVVFYPDEGAMKRYSGLAPHPLTAFGIKQRDWCSGQIKGLDVNANDIDLNGKTVLIVDDICSRGGTFYHSAKKLKELGVDKIFLYVTHCESSIFDGEIFKSGLIEKVFTTDSIFGEKSQQRAIELGLQDKIEVFNYDN